MVPFAATRFLLYSLYTLSHVIFVQASDHHKMLGRAKRHETFPTLFYPGPDNKFIIMEPKKTQGNQNLQNVQQHFQHKKLLLPQQHQQQIQQDQQHLRPQQPQLQQHQQPQLQQHQQPQLQHHQQPQLQHQQQPQHHPQQHQHHQQQPQHHQQQPHHHQQPMRQIISSQTWPAEATPMVMGVHGLYGQRITQAQPEGNLQNQVHPTIENSEANFQTPSLTRPGEHQAHLNQNKNELLVQQPVLDNFNQFDDGTNDQVDPEILFGQKEILQHPNVQTDFQQTDHIQQQNPSLSAGHNLVQQPSGVTQDNGWLNTHPQQFQNNLEANTQQTPQEIHHQSAIVKPHHTQTSAAFKLQNNQDKVQQNTHGIAQSNENPRGENFQQIMHQQIENTPITRQSPTSVSSNQVTERNQLFAHKFHFVSTSTASPITATFRTNLEDVKLTLPGESGLLPFRGATIQTTTLEPSSLQNVASGSDNIDVVPQFQLPQSTAQPFLDQGDTEVPFEDDLGTPQVPETNFQCTYSTQPTYHADIETGCSTFHLCHDGQRFPFFCPPGTLFSQTYMICDWPTRVKCG